MGIGSIALDVVRTPTEHHYRAGGSAGNVLAILGYLGWNAIGVAPLARDLAGRLVRRDLRRHRVGLAADPPYQATPVVLVRPPARDSDPTAFSPHCPACGEPLAGFGPPRAELAEGLTDRLRRHPPQVVYADRASELAARIAGAFRQAGAVSVFAPWVSGEPGFEAALADADCVFSSRERLPELAEIPLPAQRLLEVQTAGRGGLRWRGRAGGAVEWRPLPAADAGTPVDASGAGDWVAAVALDLLASAGSAGLAAATAAEVETALAFAQAAAALACTAPGPRGICDALAARDLRQRAASLSKATGGDAREGLAATVPPQPTACHGGPPPAADGNTSLALALCRCGWSPRAAGGPAAQRAVT